MIALLMVLALQQQAGVTAIRAGTLIDGTGAAPVKNAVIVVQGDRITAVGGGANVAIPTGATVIDLSSETVLPGFIDAHVHLAGRTIGDGDWQHSRLTEMSSQLALLGAAHAQQTLEAGFTTVRVVGSAAFGDVALRNAINAGWIPGPHIVAAGISFGIRGGHCDETNGLQPEALGHEGGVEVGVADGLDEVRELSHRNLVVERVKDFYSLYREAGNKFVMTSRVVGYREVRPASEGLAEATLVDFDDEEIKAFVEKWTAAIEKTPLAPVRLSCVT